MHVFDKPLRAQPMSFILSAVTMMDFRDTLLRCVCDVLSAFAPFSPLLSGIPIKYNLLRLFLHLTHLC